VNAKDQFNAIQEIILFYRSGNCQWFCK
jgi:hypothetical protein